jgi:hypothetical protein
MLGYIRGTTTRTGLTVKAIPDETTHKKGQKVTKEAMQDVLPQWNYTLSPRGIAT